MVDVGGKEPLAPPGGRAGRGADGSRDGAAILRELPKGDALATAQLAGIMAAKRTSELIPLCHPLPLTHVEVTLEVGEESVEIVVGGRDHRADRGRDGGADRGVRRGADGLRHGEGGRQADADRRGRRSSRRRRSRSPEGRGAHRLGRRRDRDARGPERRHARGAAARRRLRGRAPRRARRARPDRRGDPRARGCGAPRPHDRRHRPRAARRHARGDARRARPRGARASPRRCGRTRSRRRRTACSREGAPASSARRSSSTSPGSPGGCRDGFAVLRPALAHALELLADDPTAHEQT